MSKGFALIQEGLTSLGYGPLVADGIPGPKSLAALLRCHQMGGAPNVAAPVASPVAATSRMVDYPDRAGMVAFYGPAGGPDCTAGSVTLPFPFPLASAQTPLALAPSLRARSSAFSHITSPAIEGGGLMTLANCIRATAAWWI